MWITVVFKHLPLHQDRGSGCWFYSEDHRGLIRHWDREWEREKKNGTHRTVCFLDVLQKSTPRRHHTCVHGHTHTHTQSVIDPSLSPSCRVVTASVSLLRILSPISLVASIRNLYDVKGFRLKKINKHWDTCTCSKEQKNHQQQKNRLLVLLRLFEFVCLLHHHVRQCVHYIWDLINNSIKNCSTATQVVQNSGNCFPEPPWTFSPSCRSGLTFSVASEEQTSSWIIICSYLLQTFCHCTVLSNYIYSHSTTTCYLHFPSVQGECFTNQRVTMVISHFENSTVEPFCNWPAERVPIVRDWLNTSVVPGSALVKTCALCGN